MSLRRTSCSSAAVPRADLLHGTSNLLMSPHAPFVEPRRATNISPGAASPDAGAPALAASSASGTRRSRAVRGPEISTGGVRTRTSAPALAVAHATNGTR
eukprot:7569570-Alexandrium_andersonii.AAC.1